MTVLDRFFCSHLTFAFKRFPIWRKTGVWDKDSDKWLNTFVNNLRLGCEIWFDICPSLDHTDKYEELGGVGGTSRRRGERPGGTSRSPPGRLDLHRPHSARHFHRNGQALPRQRQLSLPQCRGVYHGRRAAVKTSQRLSPVSGRTFRLQVCHRCRHRLYDLYCNYDCCCIYYFALMYMCIRFQGL